MIYVMHVTAARRRSPRRTTLGGRDAAARASIAAGKHLTTLALSEKGSRSQFWAPVSKLARAGRRLRDQRRRSRG